MNAAPPLSKTWRPTKTMLWYDDIIDWMMLNPGRSKKECAAGLGRSPQIICNVTNSDLFKARYEFRKLEYTRELAEGTRRKLTLVADKALDVLLDKLEHKAAGANIATIAEVADSALQRLGYGITPQAPAATPASTTVVVQVSGAVLRAAQDDLRSLERAKTIEGFVAEAQGPSSRPGQSRTLEGDAVASASPEDPGPESGSTLVEDASP